MSEAWKVIKGGFAVWRQKILPGAAVSAVFLLCAVTVVFFPPALFGMNEYAYQRMKGREASLLTFWNGSRHYLGKSYLWAMLNAFAIGLAWTNLRFYGELGESLGGALQWFFYFLGLIWLIMQIYFVPYVIQLTEENVWLALRNAFFSVMAFPVYSAGLFIFLVLLAGAGSLTVIPLALGLPLLLALIGQHAAQDRLKVAYQRVREIGRAHV